MKRLKVWFDQKLVGELRQQASGRLSFAYAPAYVDDAGAPAISVSLPKRLEPFAERDCMPFFDGLLPEARQRTAVARTLGVTEGNTFSLLDRLGGEVAGALAFLEPGSSPGAASEPWVPIPLMDSELQLILTELPRRPLLAGTRGLRLSLAGAQSKLPVCWVGDQISLPGAGQPTTHILKPAIPELPGSTENEAFAMALAAELGLPVAKAEPRVLASPRGPIRFLLVERYDRIRVGASVRRLHQEDFCQALGIPSTWKYQSEGGPGFKACFELLRLVSSRPSVDLANLLDVAILNVFLGNADAHGKNFSILYTAEGPRLAPFYDLMSTVHYPELAATFAMKVGDQGAFERMGILAWKKFAANAGLSYPFVRKRIQEMAKRLPEASRRVRLRLAGAGLEDTVFELLSRRVADRAADLVARLAWDGEEE